MGVYSMNKKTNGKYPFAIFNTDNYDQPRKQWWSFIDIHPPKNLFLFDSFGMEGFKFFIVNNEEKITNELLYDFKKCEPKSNQKLKLCAMKFCVKPWQKMSRKVKDQLADTAQSFFHLLEQFAKLKKTNCINILISENNVQNLTSSKCHDFQLYFYKNLFDPDEKSKIISHDNLNKKTLEIIINEIFSTDVHENEHTIKNFKEEYDL